LILVATNVAGGIERTTSLRDGDLSGYFPTMVAALAPDGRRLANVKQGARPSRLTALFTLTGIVAA
jgi:hypothetical protein